MCKHGASMMQACEGIDTIDDIHMQAPGIYVDVTFGISMIAIVECSVLIYALQHSPCMALFLEDSSLGIVFI